jgi:hypothetical protein
MEAPFDAGAEGGVLDAAGDVTDALGDITADDASLADSDSEPDAPLDHRRVFVTAKPIMVPNFVSIDNADTVCGQRATAAGLGGSWVAWISSSTSSASSRLDHGAIPYRLLDGTEIAANWTELTSGALKHAISVNEHGGQTTMLVITGTLNDGSVNPNNTCNDWSGNAQADTTHTGNSSSTTEWSVTATTPQSCLAAIGALYCFEK